MTALAPETWHRLLRRTPADAGLSALYGPLLAPSTAPDGCYVLARLAQSLDGRIATASGASHWISCHEDILHTHRLRALFDAVVIGAGTVRADDPQLTTREVEGPSPVRVVLDTHRRLDGRYRVFREGPETLLLCAHDAPGQEMAGQEMAGQEMGGPEMDGQECIGKAPVLRLPRAREGLDIAAVLATLAERGLRRVFVEGGGITVSRFLAAGALDRLHVTIAPLLIGSGIPAFTLPEASTLTEVLRFDWSVHRIGTDVLVDIPLSRARPGIGR